MNDFIRYIGEMAQKQSRKELADPNGVSAIIRFGTVTDATGRPRVQLDGEDAATTRRYPYLASYTPTVNDRVMLVRGGSTWVVVGKIV